MTFMFFVSFFLWMKKHPGLWWMALYLDLHQFLNYLGKKEEEVSYSVLPIVYCQFLQCWNWTLLTLLDSLFCIIVM